MSPQFGLSYIADRPANGSRSGRQTERPDIQTVPHVDIERFMGDWYVIAAIPTIVEKDAYNAVERYERNGDGSVATTLRFRKGSFDGAAKVVRSVGFVRNTQSNAEWGMQFVWPVKGDYRIAYLNEDYTQTVIARNRRDYAWIMSRTPHMSNEDLFERVRTLRELGYETNGVRLVPQRWAEQVRSG